MSDENLAPCPFGCGDDPDRMPAVYRELQGWLVKCVDCLADGPYRGTKTEAAAAWNRRATHATARDSTANSGSSAPLPAGRPGKSAAIPVYACLEAMAVDGEVSTPATDRNAVLEEAARVADKAGRDCATQEWTAETIRALKSTPAPIAPSAVDEAEQLYYLLSVKWTRGDLMTWWAPKACGYVLLLERAGKYTAQEVRRHLDPRWHPGDGLPDVVAIPCAVVERAIMGFVPLCDATRPWMRGEGEGVLAETIPPATESEAGRG